MQQGPDQLLCLSEPPSRDQGKPRDADLEDVDSPSPPSILLHYLNYLYFSLNRLQTLSPPLQLTMFAVTALTILGLFTLSSAGDCVDRVGLANCEAYGKCDQYSRKGCALTCGNCALDACEDTPGLDCARYISDKGGCDDFSKVGCAKSCLSCA